MGQDSDTSSDKTNWTLWAVGIGSGVWLLVAAILFAIAEPCAKSATGFWAARVACLPPNEMGDFLAGVFAPLAFLWLIAAVFLQKSELAAQRQELRESREVAAQHVVEARRNAQFIGEQTNILTAQRNQAERDIADREVDEYTHLIATLFSKNQNQTFAYYEGKSRYHFMPVVHVNDCGDFEYISKCIDSFCDKLSRFTDKAERERKSGRTDLTIKKFHEDDLDSIALAIFRVSSLVQNASASKNLEVAGLHLNWMADAIKVYKNM